MLTQEVIQKILGIREKVYTIPEEMADKMNITFFPYKDSKISLEILYFSDKLKETFKELNVNVVPYNESLVKASIFFVIKNALKIIINNIIYLYRKLLNKPQTNHYLGFSSLVFILNRTKIKKDIAVIVLGEQPLDNLPMKYIYNFKENSIITILDFPKNISNSSTFHEHFDTAISLFTHHMTNIVIGVDKEKWVLYNFNASHPVFPLEENFKENILHALIPKVIAPIRPYKLSEFIISENHFDVKSPDMKNIIEDLVNGALIFNKTNLYPPGKKIDDLPFRNDFYRWIVKLHLDNRNGMSYGFLAIQLPGEIYPLISINDFEKLKNGSRDLLETIYEDNLYIKINLNNKFYWLRVPDVWVLSQKSGSDKTHVNPEKDLLKLGLLNGKMYLESGVNSVIDNNYKTSFDTQVILAHAVGNAIIATILKHTEPESEFLHRYLKKGISISHWHGYIHPEYVPAGWYVHGVANPHVACSSPQSAIFALDGKLTSFEESLLKKIEYKGDIHVEPHHGTNICYTSVTDLAQYLLDNPKASVLGNSYYYLYNK